MPLHLWVLACHPLGDEEAHGLPDWENSGPDLADVGSRYERLDITVDSPSPTR